MYFVAVTRSNVNPALVFEYIFLKAYLGDDFDENSLRNTMTLVYELLDETMDFGYPQVRSCRHPSGRHLYTMYHLA
jgi:AP-2 complex subunit mu-1